MRSSGPSWNFHLKLCKAAGKSSWLALAATDAKLHEVAHTKGNVYIYLIPFVTHI